MSIRPNIITNVDFDQLSRSKADEFNRQVRDLQEKELDMIKKFNELGSQNQSS